MKTCARFTPVPFIAGLWIIAAFAGCSKKTGDAIVTAKEYIAAGEERATPTPTQSPDASTPGPTPADPETEYAEAPPLAADEIVVDGYVMKKEVQGTSKDPRAYSGLEQWRISVRMVEGGRSMTVRAKRAQYERLKPGDRVKVRYSEGDYTGTVWSAEIVD